MIRLHELTPETLCWLATMTEQEQAKILDLATDVMFGLEQLSLKRHKVRSGVGANGSVELILHMILFLNERETVHGH